jgi:hypothetical protein
MLSNCDAVLFAESVTLAVKVAVPFPDGVPEIVAVPFPFDTSDNPKLESVFVPVVVNV